MSKPSSKAVTTQLPGPIADKLDALARESERSVESILEEAVYAWIERQEQDHAMTVEGLLDFDAGRVIDHQSVVAWVDSLEAQRPPPTPLVK